MRIIEILLKQQRDKSISPQQAKNIDAIQKRMDSYVDKICDPKTSVQGKEFLKSRLRDEYYDLKDAIQHFHAVAENNDSNVKYEIYVRSTGEKVPKRGPYLTRSAARNAVDKLDNAYGGYKYGYRPIKPINEAVHKLPLTNEDFDLVKELMLKPIPAAIAPIYIQEIINDDELNDQLRTLEDSEPGRDVRPFIVEWIKRVMPDQMHRFTDSNQTMSQRLGLLSPIHGYDPHMYHGSNEPITGNAYGRR